MGNVSSANVANTINNQQLPLNLFIEDVLNKDEFFNFDV